MKEFFVRIKAQLFGKINGPGKEGGENKNFAAKAKQAIDLGMKKLGAEADETRQMAGSFFRLLESKLDMRNRSVPPTEEEVREAVEQLKDVGRFSVFTTAVIIPGGAISLIGLEILARKYGINVTFVPSAFRKNSEWKYPAGKRFKRGKLQKMRKKDITDVKPFDENTN